MASQVARAERRLASAFPNGSGCKTDRSVTNSVVSQLLTVRLAEATASRELLFRELVAVLQQESNARKIVIAQYNDQKRLYPFITHGYSPHESNDLVGKLGEAIAKDDEKGILAGKEHRSFSPSRFIGSFARGFAVEPAIGSGFE